MGLFGIGKKKESPKPVLGRQQPMQSSVSNLPEFPSLPEHDTAVSEFPSYEPSISDIKKEISGSLDDDIVLPQRDKQFMSKNMVGATFTPSSESVQPSVSSKKSLLQEDKPLFVKIDRYREAMHTVDTIKAKLQDAEELLRAFEDMRSQEDEKLESWKKDLQNVKEKLLSIDRDLFEV